MGRRKRGRAAWCMRRVSGGPRGPGRLQLQLRLRLRLRGRLEHQHLLSVRRRLLLRGQCGSAAGAGAGGRPGRRGSAGGRCRGCGVLQLSMREQAYVEGVQLRLPEQPGVKGQVLGRVGTCIGGGGKWGSQIWSGLLGGLLARSAGVL